MLCSTWGRLLIKPLGSKGEQNEAVKEPMSSCCVTIVRWGQFPGQRFDHGNFGSFVFIYLYPRNMHAYTHSDCDIHFSNNGHFSLFDSRAYTGTQRIFVINFQLGNLFVRLTPCQIEIGLFSFTRKRKLKDQQNFTGNIGYMLVHITVM